ncbi:MAG: type II secretion system secretin GspD [Azoarcus sp.]|jgi:general secretion pathway protein D|nr:type II secretion system secretin GspD [Azoarcus sp.]
MYIKPIFAFLLALVLAGCANTPSDDGSDLLSGRADSPDPLPLAALRDTMDESVAPTLFPGNDAMINTPSARGSIATRGGAVTLSFEQAPVTEVVHAVLGDLLKLDYSILTPLSGEVTLRTQGPVARAEVIPLLESVLQANGIALRADASGRYQVGATNAMKAMPRLPASSKELPASGGSLLVPLQYIGAGEMADILRPIAGQEALQRVDATRNLLVLSGTRNEIDGWLEIIRTFDVDFFRGMSVGLFPLTHTTVNEVETALQALIGASGKPAGAAGQEAGASGGAAPGMQAGMPQSVPPAAMAAMGAGAGASANAGSVGGGATGPLQGLIRIVPIERLNALMVVTPRAHYLELVKTWIGRLDRPSEGSSESQLWIYPVQNGSAEHLANLLNGLYGDSLSSPNPFPFFPGNTGVANGLPRASRSTSSKNGTNSSNRIGGGGLGSGGGGFGPYGAPPMYGANGNGGATITQVALGENVRVVADPNKNALLIYANRRDYRRIEEALRRLDSAPTQVLIEASILEVTLGDDLKYGLQWYFQDGRGGSGYKGHGGLYNNPIPDTDNNISGRVSSTLGTSGLVAPSAEGFVYSLLNAGGDIRVVLNALAKKSLVNMLSNPNVMVLDNHTAEIRVGDEVPVKAGTTTTEGGMFTESIQYRDTGVTLNVKPSVNSGDMVTLDVDQSITDAGPIDDATKQRSFDQRSIVSKVAVRSGETIVLGGLIRDKKTRTKSGVPLLQDIPLIGGLFRSTGNEVSRTELIVMLTPRVIRTGQDVRQVGAELRQRMSGLQKLTGDAATHVKRLELPKAPAPAPRRDLPAAPVDPFAPDRDR